MKIKDSQLIGALVITFILMSIVQLIYIQHQSNRFANTIPSTTARAFAEVNFCLNIPPELNNTCNFTIPWGFNYNCRINVTDANVNSTFTFYSAFITSPELFNISQNGTVAFNPPESAIGNHSFQVIAYDNSGCINNYAMQVFPLEIYEFNHPPVLIRNIPSQLFDVGMSTIFYLHDYFMDPDGDPLNYTVIMLNNDPTSATAPEQIVSIQIANDSQTTVRALDCGAVTTYFYAEDTFLYTGAYYHQSTPSNPVNYSVSCPQNAILSSSGTGGGGGGGSGIVENCISEWICGKWSTCMSNGTQTLKCDDKNGCNKNDLTRYFYKNCTYVPETVSCTESWTCTNWNICANGIQSRTCSDTNSCGSIGLKPNETQSCIEAASCLNGIQDANETGIDCGGECKPCVIIEKPATVTGPDYIAIVAIAFSVSFLGLLGFAYRKTINTFISKLLGAIGAIPKKPLLIPDKDKRELIEILRTMQKGHSEKNKRQFMTASSTFVRKYYEKIFGAEVMDIQDFKKQLATIKEKRIIPLLEAYDQKIRTIETPAYKFKEGEMQAFIDESIALLYLTATFTETDAVNCAKERKGPHTGIEGCYTLMSNIALALSFSEVLAAKALYQELSTVYAALSDTDKKAIYADIMHAYHAIKYRGIFQHN